jgi:hypothetical protein
MTDSTSQTPDPGLTAAITAAITRPDRDGATVQAAATAVSQAVADTDPVFWAEAAENADGSLRLSVWESAMVRFGDLLPDQYREVWEQESGSAWQGGANELQDVLAEAVDAALEHLS